MSDREAFILSLGGEKPLTPLLKLSSLVCACSPFNFQYLEKTMTFWTYILSCSDDSFYVGHTDNLDSRISQHQYGEIPGYTQSRRPVKLVYSVESSTRDDAFALERKIKGWSRAKKQALIKGDFKRLKDLSRNRQSD
jgi:predicted GIY-YIG superfamily endonuclease